MPLAPIRINVVSAGGPPDREVVAFAHPARRANPQAPRRAVLLFNPYGQESVRTHRMLRVAADRLARQGYDVLRFDYFGSGDSPGDDNQADLQGWVADALAANEVLAKFSGAAKAGVAPNDPQASSAPTEITWLGIRLGASVALMAAASQQTAATKRPKRLVLWNPVLDGPAHLKALAADHRRALHTTYSLPDEATRLVKAFDANWPPTELLGVAVAPAMAQQIEALDGAQLAVATPHINLLAMNPAKCQASSDAAPADPARENAWREACTGLGAALTEHTITSEFDWNSEEALNTALVPADAINAVLAAVTADTP